MRRRQFIAGLGSTAAWPVVGRAQQAGRVRRVGVLMPYIERDTDARLSYFVQGLAQLGWIGGRNLRMDVRWAAGKLEQLLMYANELVALQPDALLVELDCRDRCAPTSYEDDTDRICHRFRPDRLGLRRRGPAAPGWQSYRLYRLGAVDG